MTPKNSTDIVTGIQKYFLLGVLILLIIMLFTFMSSFLTDLIIAGVIVTAVYPLHKMFCKKIHMPRSLSAFISLLITAIVILIPFALFTFFIAGQAEDAYNRVAAEINIIVEEDQPDTAGRLIKFLPFSDSIQGVLDNAPISTSDILNTAGDMVGSISSFLLGQTKNILKYLSLFLVHTVVFLMSMFFLLRDGDRLVDYLYSLMPLLEDHRKELFKKLKNLSYGIIYGIFGAAILQGFLVGAGFAIAKFENAAFWGAIAALFSPVPYIGTAIVWVPAVIILGIQGHWVMAIFLLIWGAVIVGMSDNIIKPYLIGSKSALHPLAVLLVLLGGAFTMGPTGLILGPFVLMLTLSFLHIYKMDYNRILGDSHFQEPEKAVVRKAVKKKAVRKKK